MISVTLQEAKAKLNQLVEQARAGEDVVLLRGSEIVACIKPLSAEGVQIADVLTDEQAMRFWEEVGQEETTGFKDTHEAVAFLKKRRRKRTR